MLDRLDARIDPSTAGFAVGRPTRRGVIRAWLRMRDGREPDVRMLPVRRRRAHARVVRPRAPRAGRPRWSSPASCSATRPRVAPRRALDRHRGRRPARRGLPASGTPPAASSPGPDSSPGCGCPGHLVCSGASREPGRRRRHAPGRAARHPGAGRGGARGVHPAAVAPGAAAAHPRGGGRVAGAGGGRQRRARGRVGARRRRAGHRAGGVDLVGVAGPRRGDRAWRARGDGRDRARARGGAHGAVAGARAAAHGRGDAGWSTTRRARPAAAGG